MKSKMLAVLMVLSIRVALHAQSSESTPAAPTTLVGNAPSAAIAFPDGSSIAVRCHGRQFPLVSAPAGQGVQVQLQFPTAAAGGSLGLAALDGGALAQTTTVIASDGTAFVQFTVGARPGLYRVALSQASSTSILQFFVVDPNNPSAGAAALEPTKGQ